MSDAQVVICKCEQVVAVCSVPECYQDKDWFETIEKYSNRGYEIDVISKEELKSKFGCKCKEIAIALEQKESLFENVC